MDRTQFTFYDSFYHGIKGLRTKGEQAAALFAICEYALYGTEPGTLPGSAGAVLAMAKPVLDAARRKADAGKRGGSKSKQPEANPKQGRDKQGQGKQEKEQVKEQGKEEEQMLLSSSSPSVGGEERGRPSGRFVPPTAEAVAEEIEAKGYHVDPEAFVAFYASKGWMVGKTPMKDWRAALVTWEKRETAKNPAAAVREDRPYPKPDDFSDLDRIIEEMKAMGIYEEEDADGGKA